MVSEGSDQSDGEEHFDQSRVVVVIDVRSVNPATRARRAYPVELVSRRETLQQCEHAQIDGIDRDHARYAFDLICSAQDLDGEESEDAISNEEQGGPEGIVSVRRPAENKLDPDQAGKRQHGTECRT